MSLITALLGSGFPSLDCVLFSFLGEARGVLVTMGHGCLRGVLLSVLSGFVDGYNMELLVTVDVRGGDEKDFLSGIDRWQDVSSSGEDIGDISDCNDIGETGVTLDLSCVGDCKKTVKPFPPWYGPGNNWKVPCTRFPLGLKTVCM